jgi:hypothetical protein
MPSCEAALCTALLRLSYITRTIGDSSRGRQAGPIMPGRRRWRQRRVPYCLYWRTPFTACPCPPVLDQGEAARPPKERDVPCCLPCPSRTIDFFFNNSFSTGRTNPPESPSPTPTLTNTPFRLSPEGFQAVEASNCAALASTLKSVHSYHPNTSSL